MQNKLIHRNFETPMRVGVYSYLHSCGTLIRHGVSYILFFTRLIVSRQKSNVAGMDSKVRFKRVYHALNERQSTEEDSIKAVSRMIEGKTDCSVSSYS